MSDLTREHIEEILHRAESLSSQPTLEGKQIALLFYENSTRTYSSFRTAIHRLGGLTCGFAGTAGTSVLKGESLHDTIKMFEEYADAIVRHLLMDINEMNARMAQARDRFLYDSNCAYARLW